MTLVIALAFPAMAAGDTFRVTTRSDPPPGACLPGDCSLREAVIRANATAGPDRIVLPSRKLHQLSIAGDGPNDGDLDVSDDPLRIVHPGRGRAVIDFNPPGDVFPDPLDRVFEVQPGATLTLEKLVVRDGGDPTGSPRGGGIRAYGNLTLIRTAVTGNEAPDLGGGISVEDGADLVLRRSQVIANASTGNAGGGISVINSGSFRIARSRVSGNHATDPSGDGGAIYAGNAGASAITRSTISSNSAGEDGGAIYGDTGSIRIVGSTLSKNRAGGPGGAIHDDDFDLSMVNSTVANNRSDSNGGGLFLLYGANTLNAVTIVRNLGNADGVGSEAGGGLYSGEFVSAPVQVRNSLIALNKIGGIGGGEPLASDCSSENAFDSLGHNLLSTKFICDGFDGPRDLVRKKPRIGRLKRNGGPTKTVALKQGSPAIGKADASAPDRDQRGRKRRDPDIGAFER